MSTSQSQRTTSTGLGFLLVALAGCSVVDDPSPRIHVATPNDLGVVALQTTRVVDHGTSVFTLRGLGLDDQELAVVQLTTGVIPVLPQVLPGTDIGSEIIVSVAGDERRSVTHETQRFMYHPTIDSAAARFLGVPEVTSTLQNEANLFVVDPQPVTDLAYTAGPCPAQFLLTTPLALECCLTDGGGGATTFTLFMRSADWNLVHRDRNPSGGAACRASDGVSACAGAACFFGPYGFSRAWIDLYYGMSTVIKKYTSGGVTGCGIYSAGTPTYGDVTGTNAANAGCPGADPGDGDWDY